jgi:hypothetical protein
MSGLNRRPPDLQSDALPTELIRVIGIVDICDSNIVDFYNEMGGVCSIRELNSSSELIRIICEPIH